MRYIKKMTVILLAVFVILGALFYFLRIREVRVEGGKIYSDQEIIRTAMSDRYSYHTLYFYVMSRLGCIDLLPFTQEIAVEWQSPVRVTLHVYDKTISGCVKYMGQYIYFDKDGIVLQSASEPMEGVPVVTGIKFGKFALNKAFEVEDITLFNTIMNVSGLIHHYDVQVDEIRLDDKDVTLYSGKVTVYLGKKDFYDDDMAALSSVLKKTIKKGLGGTIDMQNFQPGSRIILKTDGSPQAESSPAVQPSPSSISET